MHDRIHAILHFRVWFRRIYACLHSSISREIKDGNHIARPVGNLSTLKSVWLHISAT